MKALDEKEKESAVDNETAKLVENLKERLKTFDSDIDRVKKAAMKIQEDLNNNQTLKNEGSSQKMKNKSPFQRMNEVQPDRDRNGTLTSFCTFS